MNGVRKRVFILGGGAALGAYQIGAMRYLEERGVRPDAIIGSSIGVINACLYASGGIERMERAWADARTFPGVVRPSLRHNAIFGASLFDVGPMLDRIEQEIDYEKSWRSAMDLAFIVLNLSRGRGEMLSNRQMESVAEFRSLARAGFAIPFLFPPVELHGDQFVDGGFVWNVPLEHAFELAATEVYVIAVIPHRLPYHKRFRNIVELGIRFLDVMWRTVGNTGHQYARIQEGQHQGVPVVVLEPGEEFGLLSPFDMFNAYPRKTRRLRDAGYRDAKRTFARLARLGHLPPSVTPSARTARTPRRA
jgi:predicted acylesterase/phospholipase RssA